MADPARAKGKLSAAAAVLATICVILLAYLLWPRSAGRQPAQLREQRNSLRNQVSLWKKGNPDAVRADLNSFYEKNVPEKWSELSQRMQKIVDATGVTFTGLRYSTDQDKSAIPGVEQVKVETTVSGDYPKVARFINELEKDETFFIIDKISLSSQEGGVVTLSLTIDTFLRQNT